MQTISTEDYIKAIYKLERGGERVTTSAISNRLRIADASVTDMVQKLAARRFVRYERYKGVCLTPKGKKFALTIVRRHRLWEKFLTAYLGYSWDQVHEEAERLEHATSDELARRLDRFLGYPAADPHGDPIPTVNGELKPAVSTALADCQEGDSVRIARVSDNDATFLQHISRLGLRLKAKVTIKEKADFDGSMLVKVGSKERFISVQAAQAIYVEPA
jgi:DtxR family Mn-dependent transcriptional regulator